MKPRIVALTLLSAVLLSAADFKAGLDAYKAGDYATALREWQPLAEKGDAHAQYNLALLYDSLGRSRDAIRHMAQYRRLVRAK